ncbi:hypothetical protein K525DRAFT_287755 [Schizophyllum commune Loenen D]|nr:hypothetical protein K525DRAFT_287755 [Schizophyllum commune Loenen D]
MPSGAETSRRCDSKTKVLTAAPANKRSPVARCLGRQGRETQGTVEAARMEWDERAARSGGEDVQGEVMMGEGHGPMGNVSTIARFEGHGAITSMSAGSEQGRAARPATMVVVTWRREDPGWCEPGATNGGAHRHSAGHVRCVRTSHVIETENGPPRCDNGEGDDDRTIRGEMGMGGGKSATENMSVCAGSMGDQREPAATWPSAASSKRAMTTRPWAGQNNGRDGVRFFRPA